MCFIDFIFNDNFENEVIKVKLNMFLMCIEILLC